MSKYAGFSDRFNGPIKFLGQDLRVNRYFIIPEGRYAYYEHGKLFYEDSRTPVKAYRVWIGRWPKEGITVETAIDLITARRNEFEKSERGAAGKTGQPRAKFGSRQHHPAVQRNAGISRKGSKPPTA